MLIVHIIFSCHLLQNQCSSSVLYFRALLQKKSLQNKSTHHLLRSNIFKFLYPKMSFESCFRRSKTASFREIMPPLAKSMLIVLLFFRVTSCKINAPRLYYIFVLCSRKRACKIKARIIYFVQIFINSSILKCHLNLYISYHLTIDLILVFY